MQISHEPCTCNGRPVERLEERGIGRDDHNWYPVAYSAMPAELADAWIAADSACPLRWATVTCPRCAGTGFYEVEHVTCKIF